MDDILDGGAPNGEGPPWPLVRLDGFKHEGWGYNSHDRSLASRATALGPGSANERHVDEYLREFFSILVPLLEYVNASWDVVYDIVLTARNGRADRNRLEAIRQVAAVVPYFAVVSEILGEAGYKVAMDVYDFHDIWVGTSAVEPNVAVDISGFHGPGYHGSRGPIATCVCLRLTANGVSIGAGDGYNKWFSDVVVGYAEEDMKRLPQAIKAFVGRRFVKEAGRWGLNF